MGSVWKARKNEQVVLSACGASRGVGVIWDSNKFSCLEVVFSLTIQLNSDEEETFWLTLVYGPKKSNLRKDFWMGATRPFWHDFSEMVCWKRKRGLGRRGILMS